MRKQRAKATPATSSQGRNRLHEAQAALHFWQALEYLAPQSPPDVDSDEHVWQVKAGAAHERMPWHDAHKLAVLKARHPHWRFQIFSGIADGISLLEEACTALGAAEMTLEERRPPDPAACVVLEVNGEGMATGEVFISTVPWAMARIVEHAGTTTPIDFHGFFGPDGMQETIQRSVRNLLVERRLVRAAHAEAEADAASPQANPSAPASASAPENVLRAVCADDIKAVEDLVFDECGWRPGKQKPWRVRAIMESAKGAKRASDDPLNSFYAEDLERVSAALACGNVGSALDAYLQGEDSPGRIDLERERAALIAGVRPQQLPAGAWPAEHPLVTAQQFAVNTITRELSNGSGIFSVNGPPGTGKTTMLKDIVAATVVARADVLATYAMPASAFGDELEIDRYQYRAYALDPKLRGFGVVVGSANNGAVENISKELPGLAAVRKGLELDYFSVVADSVAAPEKPGKLAQASREHWGLIAAVLGNKENRSNFVGRFWFADAPDKKKSVKANETGEIPPPDPLRLRSIRSVIESGEHGALPWHEARARYQAARTRVENLVDQAEDLAHEVMTLEAVKSRRLSCEQVLARLAQDLAALQAAVPAAQTASDAAQRDLLAARERRDACLARAEQQNKVDASNAELARWQAEMPQEGLAYLHAAHGNAERHCQELEQEYDKHIARGPGHIAQLIRTPFSKRWNEAGIVLEHEIRQAKAARQAAATRVALAESITSKVDDATRMRAVALAELARAQVRARAAGVGVGTPAATLEQDFRNKEASAVQLKQGAARARAALDDHARASAQYRNELALADEEIARIEKLMATCGLDQDTLETWSLAGLERESLHSAAPCFMPALFDARRDLFVTAMDLHKSFIVASWSKLRLTLGAFVNLLGGGISASQVKEGPMALWDAFFLVVPLVSTTFASFPRLFAGVGREELAWLLIDEAGQAAPQQAAGAIWRARRAIVVGDPLQLEPVAAIPDELVTPLLARCAAEEQWAPPAASVQVLADRANRYGTYLGEGDQRVWLGAPLVVHRRCLDPMFTISNTISYGGMMVHGARPDLVSRWPSRWIDCPAREAEGHWVQAQGDIAIGLVHFITDGVLRSEDGQFKVYIITPFRKVAEKVRVMLYKKYGDKSNKMSGTVHTFQGKEADNVIFLLGGDPTRPGVISSFAGAKPNLVNVAVTRAKRRLYVVGDHHYWTGTGDLHGIFRSMAEQLPFHSRTQKETQ
jgi:hypothetical protein